MWTAHLSRGTEIHSEVVALMTNSVTLNYMEWSVKRVHSLAGPQNHSINFNTKWNILDVPKVATSYSDLLAFIMVQLSSPCFWDIAMHQFLNCMLCFGAVWWF